MNKQPHEVFVAMSSIAMLALLASAQPEGVFKALGIGSLKIERPANPQGNTLMIDLRDVNHDGFKDIVSYTVEYVDFPESTLSGGIAYGRADGSFESLRVYPIALLSSFPDWCISAAQLDADSDAELIYRDGQLDQFEIHQAPGDVQIVQVPDLNYSSIGIAHTSVQAGDLDGDGLDELLFNTASSELIVRWSSRAAPDQFERMSDPLIDGVFALQAIKDYNNDSYRDVLLYVPDTDQFVFFPGTGNDELGGPVAIATNPTALTTNGIPLFGHLDANPALDMLVAGAEPEQVMFIYNFATPMREDQSVDLGEPVYPLAIVGDVDHTVIDDLVIKRDAIYPPNQNGNPVAGLVLINDPSPTRFDLNEREIASPDDGVGVTRATTGSNRSPIVYGHDLDLDGDIDLLLHGYVGPLSWTENRIGEPNVEPFGIDVVRDSFNDGIHVAMLDVNSDGVQEAIVSGDYNARVINLEDGTRTRAIASAGAFMSLPADLDGDGTPELVIPDRNKAQLRIYHLQPDGSFGERAVISTMSDSGMSGFSVADFNNDGRQDIVGSLLDSNSIGVYLGDTDTLLVPSMLIDEHDIGLALKPTTLDFDHDGNTDIAFGNESVSGITLYRGLGDGSFEFVRSFASIAGYWLISDDIDGDGFDDIIACDSENYVQVSFLGEGGVVNQQMEFFAQGPLEVIADDFNGDGRMDLAAACSPTPAFSTSPRLWLQNDTRVFWDPIFLPADNSVGLASSDLSQDGIADLVILDREMLQIPLYLSTPSKTPACPADLTGDGELDFFDVSQLLTELVDYNNDGSFSFFDVSAFLIDFKAGCP